MRLDPDSGDRKLPLESVAPYSSWKHHVAEKAEAALVPIRCTERGSATTSTATGLVIRCDGFVLVPRAVRDAARNGGLVEVLYLKVDGSETETGAGNAGDGGAKRPVSPVVAPARFHPGVPASVPYALIKTNGCHVPSLPLLSSDSVAPGIPVRLLWIAPGAGDPAGMRTRAATIGPATVNNETFSLSLGESSPTAPPPGTIVVDEKSGAAIGMVTQAPEGAPPAFVTLARFPVIAGEIGLAQDRAAVRLGDRPGTLPKGATDMVFVPGGPVALDGAAGKEYSLTYGTTVACTPGFWIGVQPVSNGEYRAWVREKGRPLPFGWNDQELLTPLRSPLSPACGMFPDDASLFAGSRQSRLPTEVEWRRAAFTKSADWVEEINQDWDLAAKEVATRVQLVGILMQAASRAAAENARQRLGNDSRLNSNQPNSRVNILIPATPELEQASADLAQYTDDFLSQRAIWGQVHQIDAYRQDVSIFGVRNVLINAPELVLSRLNQTVYAAKRYPANVDPELTLFNASLRAGGSEASPATEAEFRRLLYNCLMVMNWRGGVKGVGLWSSSGSLAIEAYANVRSRVYAGFRCAR